MIDVLDAVGGGFVDKSAQAKAMAAVDATCSTHGVYSATWWYHPAKKEFLQNRCPACKKIEQEQREAEELAEKNTAIAEQKKRAFERALGNAGIPERFKTKTFDAYIASTEEQIEALAIAREYAENFAENFENGVGLAVVGSVGTGKTHLSSSIANHLIRQGYAPLFTSVFSAVQHVKDSWRKDSEFSELQAIGHFVKPDLLILDEVGVQFGSDTEKLIIFDIINKRYSEQLPTIVLSNLDLGGIEKYLGTRVYDRLREGSPRVIALSGASYRRSA